MRVVAHLSDLHFGTVVPEIAKGLLVSLLALKPDLVVISGDLTQRARAHQFQAAQDFLKRIPFPKVIVPGNHDVPLYNVFRRFWHPLKNYRHYITQDLAPFFQDQAIAVLGVNTARSLTFKNGRISDAQTQIIRTRFCPIPDHIFKILVTHHPFLPSGVKGQNALVGEAVNVLQAVEDCRLDIVLSGHFHMSYAGETQAYQLYTVLKRSLLVIQAGTATSYRTRHEQNAYNVLQLDCDRLKLIVYKWNGHQFSPWKTARYLYDKAGNWDTQ